MNYVEEILDKGGSAEDKFYSIADIVVEKEVSTSFTSLKVEEKNIYMLDKLLEEINNGGLDEYFFNTDGKYYKDTIHLLKMLEQFEFAEILHHAALIYFDDKKAEDRFDLLNEFDERIYNHVDFDKLFTACIQYLRSYKQKFN